MFVFVSLLLRKRSRDSSLKSRRGWREDEFLLSQGMTFIPWRRKKGGRWTSFLLKIEHLYLVVTFTRMPVSLNLITYLLKATSLTSFAINPCNLVYFRFHQNLVSLALSCTKFTKRPSVVHQRCIDPPSNNLYNITDSPPFENVSFMKH